MPTNAINDTGVKYLYDKLHGEIEPVAEAVSDNEVTIEGNPLNFTTLSAQNAKSTILSVEPIQDLHGYDKPWVGGAGKNLLPMTVDNLKAINTSGTWSGNTYTKSDIQFTILTDSDNNVQGIKVNGTKSVSGEIVFFIQNRNSSNFTLPANSYYINGFPQDAPSNSSVIRFQATRDGSLANLASTSGYGTGTVGEVQNGDLLQVTIVILGNATITNSIYYPMLRLSTETDATFQPYTNECGISGRTEIGILGCGVNLIEYWEQGAYSGSTGLPMSSEKYVRTNKIVINPNVQYVLSKVIQNSGNILYWDKYGNFISSDNINWQVYTVNINAPSNARYIAFNIYDNTAISPSTVGNIQLEVGNQATDYSPYTKSNDLTIQLGQTVYGARHDVENGVLVADRKYFVVDTVEKFSGSSTKQFYVQSSYTTDLLNTGSVYCQGLCSDKFESSINTSKEGVCFVNQYGTIRFNTSKEYSSKSDLLSDIGNIAFVYPLKEESWITINLTPHTIKLLEGVNNISTDGDKITLTYRDGSVATLGDLTSAVDSLDSKIDESKILTDTATGDKYILVVTNGVLSVEQVSN